MHESATVLAFMDIDPVTAGHVLVVPKAHLPTLADLDDDVAPRCSRSPGRSPERCGGRRCPARASTSSTPTARRPSRRSSTRTCTSSPAPPATASDQRALGLEPGTAELDRQAEAIRAELPLTCTRGLSIVSSSSTCPHATPQAYSVPGTRPAVAGSCRPDVGGPPEVRRAPVPACDRDARARTPHTPPEPPHPDAQDPSRPRPHRRRAHVDGLLHGEHPAGVTEPPRRAPRSPRSPSTTAGRRSRSTAAAPKVVTIKSTSTEMLLALGLAGPPRGHGVRGRPVPDEYEDAYAAVPVVSDKVPRPGGAARAGAGLRLRRLGVRTSRPRAPVTARRSATSASRRTSPPPRARRPATCRTR